MVEHCKLARGLREQVGRVPEVVTHLVRQPSWYVIMSVCKTVFSTCFFGSLVCIYSLLDSLMYIYICLIGALVVYINSSLLPPTSPLSSCPPSSQPPCSGWPSQKVSIASGRPLVHRTVVEYQLYPFPLIEGIMSTYALLVNSISDGRKSCD